MEKLLILGGSHRDIPLIKAAQKLGLYVITVGNGNRYIGHRYANSSYFIDFNDINEVRNIIKREKIDYLIPGCGEESYLNTIKISRELRVGNLDSLEVALTLQNKWKFKQFCLKHDIPVPKGILLKAEDNIEWNKLDLKFPVLIKPPNLSGGRGVALVNKSEEMMSIIKQKKCKEFILEEFIDGRLIAYSVIIKDKKVVYEFVGADETFINRFLVTTAYPIKLNENIAGRIKENVEKIAEELDLVDGVFHLQMILKNDIPYIIDVARRIPGDLYPYLIEFSDGFEYSLVAVKSYLGMNFSEELNFSSKKKFIIRHCVMPEKNGTYKGLFISNKIKNKIKYRLDIIDENSNFVIDNFLKTVVSIVFLEHMDRETYQNGSVSVLSKMIYPIIE